jgi:hypothetical protein
VTQYSNPDPRNLTPDERDALAAKAAVNAARCEQPAATEPAPAAVDPTPAAKPTKKRSWAMTLHEEAKAGEVTGADHLALATDAYGQAVQAKADAEARIRFAEESLVAARNRADLENKELVRREAETKLRTLATKVEALQADLLALHRRYGGPARTGMERSRGVLADYAKSIASDISPVRRAKVAALYALAGPLADRVANGYIQCVQAIKSFTIATTRGFGVEAAELELRAALEIDAEKLGAEIARLIAEVTAWKGGQAESGGSFADPSYGAGLQPEIGPWRS